MRRFLNGLTPLLVLNQRSLLIGLIVVFLIGNIGCPPPRRTDQQVPTNKPADPNDVNENDMSAVEYNRYLQEVVQLLENDADFRSKLEKSDPEDIRTGKVAKELEFVNHHVRNKLDELKRQELERLRHAAMQEYEHAQGLGIPYDGARHKIPGHLDHRSPKFEIEDLRKLIVQTTRDLEESDRKRKESFKEYEMQKEFEHQAKLKEITDEEKRKAEEKAWEEAQKKHAQHPKIHHPGSKQQLEEVWEEQDHMAAADFNPKTFFALHDLDGNGVWDQDEVKALFIKELDKAYDPNAPEDDMAERYEEMERMREHVFNETDTDRNSLISFAEFLEQTRKEEFKRDPGWNTIEDEPVYSEKEYMEFEKRRQMEIQRMVEQGLLPPHPGMPMPYNPNAQYGMPPMPGQYGVPQQPYYPPQPMGAPQQKPGKQITPDEAYKLHQQQPPQQFAQPQQNQAQFSQQQQQFAGQPQYVQQPYAGQQQQFAQQPYAGQPQQGQYIQQPYAGQQQAQFAQQPYAGQQQGQFAQQPYAGQQAQFAQQNIPQQAQQVPVQQPIQTNQGQNIQQPAAQQPVQTNLGQNVQQPPAQQNIQPHQSQPVPVAGQQQQQVPVAQQAQQNQQPAAGQQPIPSVNVH